MNTKTNVTVIIRTYTSTPNADNDDNYDDDDDDEVYEDLNHKIYQKKLKITQPS